MEKKQVSTFLKILQIPSDAPPDEIKDSLLQSGWNEKDAEEAIGVLYPGTDSADISEDTETETTKQADGSQIVAQKYVRSSAPAEPTTSDELTEIPTAKPDEPEPIAPSTASESEAPPQPAFTPEAQAPAFQEASDTSTHREALDPEAEKNRPHTDAPWLDNQVDIYDVTPEEREEMIRTVYRTNERLSPQTIHALLGIDVDLSEYEEAYERRQQERGFQWIQILIILLSSVAIASVALLLGLYFLEVGPFHPTITGGR